MLTAPFTTEDIRAAVRGSKSRKSPGRDGITAEFYKRTWDIIGEDLTAVLNEIVSRGRFV